MNNKLELIIYLSLSDTIYILTSFTKFKQNTISDIFHLINPIGQPTQLNFNKPAYSFHPANSALKESLADLIYVPTVEDLPLEQKSKKIHQHIETWTKSHCN